MEDVVVASRGVVSAMGTSLDLPLSPTTPPPTIEPFRWIDPALSGRTSPPSGAPRYTATMATRFTPEGTDRVHTWLSESGAPAPERLHPVGDDLSARKALARLRDGQVLRWTGDFHQGRRMLSALKKRLGRQARRPRRSASLAERWALGREQRHHTAELLGRLVVVLDPDGSLPLRRAPDTRRAITLAWGPLPGTPLVLGLPTLQGAMGAAGWTDAGLEVPGLRGRLVPRYGVFSPTRHAYVSLVDRLDDPTDQDILDVGTGTGVLALLALQRGAARAVGTDLDPRALDAAAHNADVLGLSDRFTACRADLFPTPDDAVPARYHRVLFNAPWMPAEPHTRLDRAVYDPDGQTVRRFLRQLPHHLHPGGHGVLIVSDLPERLGLRDDDALPQAVAEAGLTVTARHDAPATHKRSRDTADPLHAARAAERIVAWVLSADGAGG